MSAAITTLAELATLNNTGATTEQQITEGKALFVLDSGSGFSGTFIYRSGTLPSELLGIQSTGVPGGYWEAVGYKDLVEWVVAQNFTVSGHAHSSADISDFEVVVNGLIQSSNIPFNNLTGGPDTIVSTVNGQFGDVTITLESLGGSAVPDFFEVDQILDFDIAVNNLINNSTSVAPDWANIQNKPATATQYPSANEVIGLDTLLDVKQNTNTNLSAIAYLGDNPPATGFLEKTANQTWQLISLVSSKIIDFTSSVNTLITTAMSDLSKYPSTLSAIAQLTGDGYINRSAGVWRLDVPTGSASEPGQYGVITEHNVGSTPITIVPALAENSFVRITINPSNPDKFVYFTDNGTDPTVNSRSFLLLTGFMGFDGELGAGTLFAAGTEIKAFSPDGAVYVYTQIAPIVV